VFGPLLEQIDDIAELKLTLRVVWLLHNNKRGYPRSVTLSELETDRVLVRALPDDGGYRRRVRLALDKAVARGTLACYALSSGSGGEWAYTLNTEHDTPASVGIPAYEAGRARGRKSEALSEPVERPNVFALYETNIGMLNPMIADELREAEELYPAEWIEDAFREAVENNARSWRYVDKILQRWEREGKSDGERRRYSKEAGNYKEFFRR
jgi:DnaD/phage-associated family protein